MTESLPPMDWYPDPADSTRERYWDGTTWTHNTRARRAPQEPVGGADPWQARDPQTGHEAQTGYAPSANGVWGQAPGAGYEPARSDLTADGIPLAGWWQRAGARILDALICQVLGAIVGWKWLSAFWEGYIGYFQEMMRQAEAGKPVSFDGNLQRMINAPWFTDLQTFISVLAIVVFVYQLLMLRWKGATLGKMALGLQVVPTGRGMASGGLSWRHSLLRPLAEGLFGQIPMLPFLDWLFPLWQGKRQSLHDLVAGTQVVRRR